jgi:hypothetical protein
MFAAYDQASLGLWWQRQWRLVKGSDGGCNNGWRYGIKDGFEDGSPLGFKLDFVKGYDGGWDDLYKGPPSPFYILKSAERKMAETTEACRRF